MEKVISVVATFCPADTLPSFGRKASVSFAIFWTRLGNIHNTSRKMASEGRSDELSNEVSLQYEKNPDVHTLDEPSASSQVVSSKRQSLSDIVSWSDIHAAS